ncbi:MAG TPA: hypothetical protein VLH85_06535 [Levilinea sp.]|nr:hypothetical protein [Levilinea sp.]
MDKEKIPSQPVGLTQFMNRPLVGLHALFIGLLSLWSSLTLSPLVERFPRTDSGVFLYTGWRILNGALPFTLFTYFCFYRAVQTQRPFSYPFIICILGGLAFLSRPNLMSAMIAAAGSFFVLGVLLKQFRLNLLRLAALAGGFVLTLTVCALALLALGILGDFIQQTFLYNLSYSSGADMGNRITALRQGLKALPGGRDAAILLMASWAFSGIWLLAAYLRKVQITEKIQGGLFVFLALPVDMVLSIISGRPYSLILNSYIGNGLRKTRPC